MRISLPKSLLCLTAFGVLLFPPSITGRDTPEKRVTVGGKEMSQRLIHKVAPVYPVEAREAKIEGTVKMTAVIAVDGSVQQLRVDEGHPLLAKAALDAVKQWKYEPLVVDGIPVEVKTSIYVVFQLKN